MVKTYECRACGQIVISDEPPQPIRWTDGHVCFFKVKQDPEIKTPDPSFKKGDKNETVT